MSANSDSALVARDQNIVKEMVKSIMILDISKKPFKYSDILSNLKTKPVRKRSAQIFAEAKNRLATMGLILHEISHPTNKMYFLTSKYQPLESMYKYASNEEIVDRILLTLVLTYIFMKNGSVTSDMLLRHLHQLGIYDESKTSHPYFGNVKKKVFTDFTEQLYLTSAKVGSNQDLFEIKWGIRAESEVNKRSILELVCTRGLQGSVEPKQFTFQYDQVLKQEIQYPPDNVKKTQVDNDKMMQVDIVEMMQLDNIELQDFNKIIQDMDLEGEQNENHGSAESL